MPLNQLCSALILALKLVSIDVANMGNHRGANKTIHCKIGGFNKIPNHCRKFKRKHLSDLHMVYFRVNISDCL